jgi:hypothetical protein
MALGLSPRYLAKSLLYSNNHSTIFLLSLMSSLPLKLYNSTGVSYFSHVLGRGGRAGGGGGLREKSPPGPGPPRGNLAWGLFFLPFFMALFHAQNTAGKNPLLLMGFFPVCPNG